MSRLVRALADESKYFPIFLGVLTVYAVIGVVLFGLTVNYALFAAKYVAMLFMFGAIAVGAGGRVVHNLCYAKVNGEKNDSEGTV